LDYVKSVDYLKFKKEFKDEKTFVEDIFNEMQSQLTVADDDAVSELANLINYRLSYAKYPKNIEQFKLFKKEWTKIATNYFDRIALDLKL